MMSSIKLPERIPEFVGFVPTMREPILSIDTREPILSTDTMREPILSTDTMREPILSIGKNHEIQ